MAEWFKAPVLKTGVPARVPWVRIPPLPPKYQQNQILKMILTVRRTIERTMLAWRLRRKVAELEHIEQTWNGLTG